MSDRTSELPTYQNVHHVHNLFEQSADGDNTAFHCTEGEHLVIVGGGLTAVQLAVRAAREGKVHQVTLLVRDRFRERQFGRVGKYWQE